MKALTLRHPWPAAIVKLGKDVENRTWTPPVRMGGQDFAIHGGAVPRGSRLDEALADAHAIYDLCNDGHVQLNAEQRRWLRDVGVFFNPDDWIMPGIVAVARYGGFVMEDPIGRRSLWFFGPYGWQLEDVRVLSEPVPCSGRQGLWDVPESVLHEVQKQLGG